VDAIQDLFINPDWTRSVMTGQSLRDQEEDNEEGGLVRSRKPSFARCAEYARLKSILPEMGYDMDKACLYYYMAMCTRVTTNVFLCLLAHHVSTASAGALL
jgi:hypothetical protein